MDCGMPGFSVYHQLPELFQTHVHWVSDAMQPSHLLLSPSPPAFNLSQHQGLFKWVSSSHQAAKVLEFQFQHQSFQWIFRTDFLPKNTQDWSPLGWTGLISLQSKRLLRVFSNTTVRKHQFYGTQLFFMIQFSHPYMTTGKTSSLTRRAFVGKTMSLLFNCCIGLSIAFLPKNKHLLIAVTICSDFGAQEN